MRNETEKEKEKLERQREVTRTLAVGKLKL
jgi:hypothetical protein